MAVSMEIKLFGKMIARVDGIAHTTPMNVQQLLEAAYDLGSYPFSLRYHGSSLGYEVATLDGIAAQNGSDADTYLFWALYINNELSSTGIDRTVIDDGDVITWNYQDYATEDFDGTRHEEIRDRMMAR